MLLASGVFMVEPARFGFNSETGSDNFFQNRIENQNIHREALEEFAGLRAILLSNGIEVHTHKAATDYNLPDEIFPNNWFSTFPGNRLVIYPMKTANRRREKNEEVIKHLKRKYKHATDLSFLEDQNEYLEGTGSLVIDHERKIAFASMSQRTTEIAVKEWQRLTGYDVMAFQSHDSAGLPIYHTNVVMSLANGFSIICSAAIDDPGDRQKVIDSVSSAGEVIDISPGQLHNFCCNCLALQNQNNKQLLVMSTRAFENFSPLQIKTISSFADIIHSPLGIIETIGGGGARCMMAELF